MNRFALVIAITMWAVAPRVCRAQTDTAELTNLALEELRGGRWEEGRTLLLQLYEVRPSGEALRLIAAASYELRQYALAVRYFERSLVETTRPLNATQRAEAENGLETARRFIGTVTIQVDVPNAVVHLDGQAEATPLGEATQLDVGEHYAVVVAEGYRRREMPFRVAGGSEWTLTIELFPLAPVPAAPSLNIGASDPVASERAGTEPRSSTGRLGVALVSVGGAALAGGVVSSVIWGRRNHDIAETCPCVNQAQAETERNTAAGLAIGLLALGATGVAVGIIQIRRASDDGDASEPALVLEVRGPGLVCRGTF